MKRRLLNLVSALSLLLCVAALVLWVRSYRVSDVIRRDSRRITVDALTGHSVELRFAGGGLALKIATFSNSDPDLRLWRTRQISAGSSWEWTADQEPMYPVLVPTGENRSLARGGFVWMECSFQSYGILRYHENSAVLPWWSVVLSITVLPLFRLSRLLGIIRQSKRARGGSCRRCGYDLRASPNRCPECGTPVNPAGSPLTLPARGG